jgi:hypothetical protein
LRKDFLIGSFGVRTLKPGIDLSRKCQTKAPSLLGSIWQKTSSKPVAAQLGAPRPDHPIMDLCW